MPKLYLVRIRFYILVILVGLVAGLGAIFFRGLIGLFHNLFFYGKFTSVYDVLQHAAPSVWGAKVIFVPVVGAILVAFLVKNFALEAKGPGVSEVMNAIYYKRGIIRPIVTLVKPLASSICIGSGGSVGREGPIIQIGAAFGSTLGQWMKVKEWERITLIACGAGGGIAASFNAPFAGILFALEIMLPEWSARTMIPVSIATALATYISYLHAGSASLLTVTLMPLTHFNFFIFFSYLILSVLLGVAATLFIYSIHGAEDVFNFIHGNYYVRHMIGMFIVGLSMYLMLYFFGHYYVQGLGYATVQDVLNALLTHPGFLFFLAGLKLIDTAITLGSGGSGGIFSPLLFVGATLGASFIGVCNYFFPAAEMNLQLGALAGIAGILGASTAAPLTAIVMTAELTDHFSLILPFIAIVAIAYGVRRLFLKESIYTYPLARRGHPIPTGLRNKFHVMM